MKNTDKQLDDLAKKVIHSSTLEQPSLEFTNTIMSKIEAIKPNSVFDVKPLISKSVWFVIATIIIGVFAYSLLNTSTESLGWFNNSFRLRSIQVDLSFFSDFFSGFTVSKTVLYSVLLFGIMFSIQIPILKNYLDKRHEI